MNEKPRILLLLPCTNRKPYITAPSWKYVLKHIEPWRDYIALAAVDCIKDPSTGLPFGIVGEWEQELTVTKDELPNPQKIDSLVAQIRKKLRELVRNYDYVIAYINVKTYWKALERLGNEFNIKMLPSVFKGEKNWNGKICHASPIGVFKREIVELTKEIEEIVDNYDES